MNCLKLSLILIFFLGLAVHNGREAAEADVLRHGGQEQHRVLAQGSGRAADQAQKVDEAEAVRSFQQKMIQIGFSCLLKIVLNKCFMSALELLNCKFIERD